MGARTRSQGMAPRGSTACGVIELLDAAPQNTTEA